MRYSSKTTKQYMRSQFFSASNKAQWQLSSKARWHRNRHAWHQIQTPAPPLLPPHHGMREREIVKKIRNATTFTEVRPLFISPSRNIYFLSLLVNNPVIVIPKPQKNPLSPGGEISSGGGARFKASQLEEKNFSAETTFGSTEPWDVFASVA